MSTFSMFATYMQKSYPPITLHTQIKQTNNMNKFSYLVEIFVQIGHSAISSLG